MTDTHESSQEGESPFDELFFRYADRLNTGEGIDKDDLRAKHPDLADRLLKELECYEYLGGQLADEAPLGTLGDYTLLRQIGRGGMAVVYEARQNSLDRDVALKVLPIGLAADNRSFVRFMREAKTAARLNHPNVVQVHSVGVEKDTPYYSMELVQGETLAQILAEINDKEPDSETTFGPKDQVDYFAKLARAFAEVADGLQHAHSERVVHRDIKPSNLILDGQGRLRILDFGLAHLEGQESLTLSGDVVGTPVYMSPEQAKRRKIPLDHRTDIYSLGATLYELLTSKPPFRGKDDQDTLSQIIERDPRAPRQLNARVPQDLETIVLKCLRKDAVDRYGTAEALGQDLRRFVRGDPIEARPQSQWERLRKRAWRCRLRIAVGVIMAVFVLTVGLLAWTSYDLRLERKEAQYRELIERGVGLLEVGSFGEALVHKNRRQFFAELAQYLVTALDPRANSGAEGARGALFYLKKAVSLFPERPDARYHLARGLWYLGRGGEALRVVDESLTVAPDFAPLHSLSATIRRAQHIEPGPRLESRRDLEGWADLWFQAQAAVGRKEWQRARETYDELIALDEDGGEFFAGAALELRLGRGLSHLHAGQPEKARLDFAMAHALWPEALIPPYLIALTFELGERSDLAADWFSQYQRATRCSDARIFRFLVDLKDKDFDTLVLWLAAMRPGYTRDRLLAYVLINAGRSGEALDVLSESPGQVRQDAVSLALAAVAKAYSQGEAAEAEKLIKQALDVDARNPTVYLCAAWVYDILGKQGKKARISERWLEVEPDAPLPRFLHADGLLGMGNVDEALAIAEDEIGRWPRFPSWGNLLGYVYMCKRLDAEAEQQLKRSLELDPGHYYAVAHLGMVYHQEGRLEEAERYYREAIKLFPAEGRAPAGLALLLEGESRVEEALPVMLATLKDNNFRGRETRQVHAALQDLLLWKPRIEPKAELDDIAAELETLFQSDSTRTDVLATLSLLLLHAPACRNPERALELAHEALEERADDPRSRATLAAVQFAHGVVDDAIRTLEKTAQLPGEQLRQLEDYRQSFLPSLASYASAEWALERARREVLIADGASWRYLTTTHGESPPGDWIEVDFIDQEWQIGPSGFGYGGGDDATALEPRAQEAVYLRRLFSIPEPGRYRGLVLSLYVDGGYTAYLNGDEVGRGVVDVWRGRRRRPHVLVELHLDPRLLREGENVVAVRVHDAALFGRGLSLIPVLRGEKERELDAERTILANFSAVAKGEEGARTLHYLEAGILHGDGKHEQAGQIYEQLATAERSSPEPHLRYGAYLLGRGEPAAAETHLRHVLGDGLEARELWELWAVVAFRELGWTARDVRQALPAVESVYAGDLHWLLERLEADGALRVNCGGGESTGRGDATWGADRFFTSGRRERNLKGYLRVTGTDEESVHETTRSFLPTGADLPGYRLPLPRGRYAVTLHFAEINFAIKSPGQRVFDVVIEGDRILEGYDAVGKVGFATADAVKYEVLVEDGTLDIGFVHRVRSPAISAIEVRTVE